MLALVRQPSLRGYDACMVNSGKGALRRNCRQTNYKTSFSPSWFFFCLVEILLKVFGGYFYGIFGLGGHDILVHPPMSGMLVLSFIMLVAGLLMETLLSVLVLIFLLLLSIG